VLVESPGFGRSRENWTVHFEGSARVGDLIEVQVASASLVALRGAQTRLVEANRAAGGGAFAPHGTPARERLRLAVVGQ
jgi:hypothetical protein